MTTPLLSDTAAARKADPSNHLLLQRWWIYRRLGPAGSGGAAGQDDGSVQESLDLNAYVTATECMHAAKWRLSQKLVTSGE